MTKKDFLLDSLKTFILREAVITPSCDVCGYVHSFSRETVKGIEGTASFNFCQECFSVIERNDGLNFEMISTDEVY